MKNIKHFIRDSLIFLIHHLGISYCYRRYKLKQGPLVRVLCFHDVADKAWFLKVITMLEKNFHIISPAQFHQQEFNANKINLLLTFDDGYQTWLDNCLPVLEKFNIKGLFFINSGLLDVAENTEKTNSYMKERLFLTPKKPLTWTGAKKLLEQGYTIGGHTVTHPSLARLNKDEVQKEVEEDKNRIEQQLTITLQDFSYPYGTTQDYSEVTIQQIKTMGYNTQYSAVSGFVNHPRGRKIVPRTLFEKNQSLFSINMWMKGGYDVFRKFINYI